MGHKLLNEEERVLTFKGLVRFRVQVPELGTQLRPGLRAPRSARNNNHTRRNCGLERSEATFHSHQASR